MLQGLFSGRYTPKETIAGHFEFPNWFGIAFFDKFIMKKGAVGPMLLAACILHIKRVKDESGAEGNLWVLPTLMRLTPFAWWHSFHCFWQPPIIYLKIFISLQVSKRGRNSSFFKRGTQKLRCQHVVWNHFYAAAYIAQSCETCCDPLFCATKIPSIFCYNGLWIMFWIWKWALWPFRAKSTKMNQENWNFEYIRH